jgi:hypothetical protein
MTHSRLFARLCIRWKPSRWPAATRGYVGSGVAKEMLEVLIEEAEVGLDPVQRNLVQTKSVRSPSLSRTGSPGEYIVGHAQRFVRKTSSNTGVPISVVSWHPCLRADAKFTFFQIRLPDKELGLRC